jgi:hypothetical protein
MERTQWHQGNFRYYWLSTSDISLVTFLSFVEGEGSAVKLLLLCNFLPLPEIILLYISMNWSLF